GRPAAARFGRRKIVWHVGGAGLQRAADAYRWDRPDTPSTTDQGRDVVRVTGTGHAGMLIETRAGSILCDPWVNPAYFASWFPFPDNSGLDWDALGQTDFLYVSHLHRDHFDEKNLREKISKQATVLLPDYPTSELEDELRELGFRDFIKAPNREIT